MYSGKVESGLNYSYMRWKWREQTKPEKDKPIYFISLVGSDLMQGGDGNDILAPRLKTFMYVMKQKLEDLELLNSLSPRLKT